MSVHGKKGLALLALSGLLLVSPACAPVTYRDSTPGPAASAPARPEQAAYLAELQSILKKYGTPVSLEACPGFRLNTLEYSITARLFAENRLDLEVYWKPEVRSEFRLPLIIADIRSHMAEVFAQGYTIQEIQ